MGTRRKHNMKLSFPYNYYSAWNGVAMAYAPSFFKMGMHSFRNTETDG